jgi:hypothetical protein
MATSKASAALSLAAAASLLAACQRDQVSHFRVPKSAPAPAAATGATMPAGMAGDVPPPASPAGGAALRWTLPKGWTEGKGDPMRLATLKPPVPGRIDVSVVVLPGPAGGELANVNRWRNQIGLAPLDEASLAAARKPVQTKAGPISVYDFTSEGQARSRVVAGLTEVEGNTWFVKMSGDAAAVAAARSDFLRLVESLRRAESN